MRGIVRAFLLGVRASVRAGMYVGCLFGASLRAGAFMGCPFGAYL